MIKFNTYEKIRDFVDRQGYSLLYSEYVKSNIKQSFTCSAGHLFDMTWNNFQRGKRCPTCARNKKKSDNEIQNIVNDLGFELLSLSRNKGVKLQIKCHKGHTSTISYGNLITRKKCPKCSNEDKRTSCNIIHSYMNDKGYKWLDNDYINNDVPLHIECDKGHFFKSRWRHIQLGYDCPICNGNRSMGEREVADLVLSLYNGTVIFNDRTQIINPITGKNLELDVYIPDIKKAIEYNSSWTHRDEGTKYKDEQKIVQCKKLGIDLLLIDDNEWFNDKTEQTNKLKMFMEV